MGLGNPCTAHDRSLFATMRVIAISNGNKALFWESAWPNGMRLNGIAPFIFDLAKNEIAWFKKQLKMTVGFHK
jgi:hypothetical protein